jgi:UDP-glucose 4-epimerase
MFLPGRSMACILITGGAGYVGSHCAKALAAKGHRVVVFDNLTIGHRDFIRWGRVIEGDIRDAIAVGTIFSSYQIDAVMHFAALAYVGESVAVPNTRSLWQTDSIGVKFAMTIDWALRSASASSWVQNVNW